MAWMIVSNKPVMLTLFNALKAYAKLSVCLYLIILVLRIFEIIQNSIYHSISGGIIKITSYSFLYDLLFWIKLSGWLFLLYLPFYLINKRIANLFFIIASTLFFILNTVLIQYFNAALVPLGADVYGYSINDIELTVGTGGSIKKELIAGVIVLILVLTSLLLLIKKFMQIQISAAAILISIFVLAIIYDPLKVVGRPALSSEYLKDLTLNKANFFIDQSYVHFFPIPNEVDIYADNYLGSYEAGNDSLYTFKYVDDNNYPFLHSDSTPDVLSAFFNKAEKLPNIVIVMVEGLGRAYSNDGAELGSFTPFLDSLSEHSLYWENFLSQGGRTFAVLPALLASLPFGEKGVLAMGEKMPEHLSLINLLKYNGYQTSFYYGGNAGFDNMNIFFRKNGADSIHDERTFPNDFVKMPLSQNGYTWGYGDKELFRRYFQLLNKTDTTRPYFSALLTVSSHFPFIINEQEKYMQKFGERMDSLNFDDKSRAERKVDAMPLASILYTDDALKYFMKTYTKRPDFQNTIFVITGDHRIPEMAMSTKLDRFHVPFMIYSPLLKRSAKFSSISTHFDAAPSLLAYLKNNYKIQLPTLVSWMGSGLDTARIFQNKHAYALKQSKSEEIDFIMGNYQLHNSSLFLIGQNLKILEENDNAKVSVLTAAFNQYKQRNTRFINGARLLPDSIYNRFRPRK